MKQENLLYITIRDHLNDPPADQFSAGKNVLFILKIFENDDEKTMYINPQVA